MAVTVSKSLLASQLGASGKEALKKHAKEPPQTRGDSLPPGMKDAIAQLDHCGLEVIGPGKTNEGKVMFRASGVIKDSGLKDTPDSFAGQKVRGRKTSIMRTFIGTDEEKTATALWMQDEIKKLWPEVPESMLDVDKIEETMRIIVQKKPHFRFSTSKRASFAIVKRADGFVLVECDDSGKPGDTVLAGPCKTEIELKNKDKRAKNAGTRSSAGVWENWHGYVSYNGQAKPGAAVTVAEETPSGESTETAEETPTEPFTGDIDEPQASGGEGGEPAATDEIADLCAVADMADGQDDAERDEARARLGQIALEAGMSEEDWENFEITQGEDGSTNYAEVFPAKLEELRAATNEPAAEPEPEPFVPKKGVVCILKRKKPLKDLEVEITNVMAKSRMVNLKNNTDGKPILDKDKKFRSFSFDDLAAK